MTRASSQIGSTSTLSANDRAEIQDLLFRFMRSFDEKDWDAMRGCLAQAVDCDYSSFRGRPPSKIERDEYIGQRKAALSSLKTQHNLSNISIARSGTEFEVKCNFSILRFHPDFDGSPERFFHSYGQYRFIVISDGKARRIAFIKQTLLMNDGNSGLHAGLR